MKLTAKKTMVFVAVIAAIVGMIIYIYTSVTGYLSGTAMNAFPVVGTIVAAVLLICSNVVSGSGKYAVADIVNYVAYALIVVSMLIFVWERVGIIADLYFIPVNYPQGEVTTFRISAVGGCFYMLSILVLIINGFKKYRAAKA